MSDSQHSSGLFYGWKVVAAILVVLTFAAGLSFYNHAVILDALARQPQFTVESVSFAVSLFFVSSGVSGVWIGRLLMRYDVRWCMTVGALLSAVSLAGLAVVQNVYQLGLLYVLLGTGFSASGLLPCTTLVARWFHRRRALALSFASTGLSLGGVLITPASAALVERTGLSVSAQIWALAYLLGVLPTTWIWIRPSPASMGLGVDGGAAPAAGDDREEGGISFRDARRHRFFWAMSGAYVLLMLAQVGGIAHQYGLVAEVMASRDTALALAILPVSSIVGRLAGGWILEFVSLRRFAFAMMALQFASLSLLALGGSVLALFAGLAAFGVTVGNLLMLQPLLIAEAFGPREYSQIFSAANLMTSLGPAFGPAVLGALYGWQGSYAAAYALAALAGLLGLALFASAGPVEGARRVFREEPVHSPVG